MVFRLISCQPAVDVDGAEPAGVCVRVQYVRMRTVRRPTHYEQGLRGI
jgi:hypothetical protein